MKKLKGPMRLAAFSAAVGFILLAFFGFHVRNGDIVSAVIRGAEDAVWGMDTGGGFEAVFKPCDGANPREGELETAGRIIGGRLAALGLIDSRVGQGGGLITARFSLAAGHDADEIAAALCAPGELTLCEGAGRQKAILHSSDIERASAVYTHREDGSGLHMLRLELTGQGGDKFYEATGRLLGETISVWLDDRLISSSVVMRQVGEGVVDLPEDLGVKRALLLADWINAGPLPLPLELKGVAAFPPVISGELRQALPLIAGAALLLFTAAVMVACPMPGAAAALALTGQAAVMTAAATGFFASADPAPLTLPGLAGMALAAAINGYCLALAAGRIKREAGRGRPAGAAVGAGLKSALPAVGCANAAAMVTAAALTGAFGPERSLFGRLLSPAARAAGLCADGRMYCFGYALLSGAAGGLAAWFLLFCPLLRCLSRPGGPDLPSLYGGAPR